MDDEIEKSFQLFEMTPTSNKDEIKKAYRIVSLKYHPDKNLDVPDAKEKFQNIKRAYDILIEYAKKMELRNLKDDLEKAQQALLDQWEERRAMSDELEASLREVIDAKERVEAEAKEERRQLLDKIRYLEEEVENEKRLKGGAVNAKKKLETQLQDLEQQLRELKAQQKEYQRDREEARQAREETMSALKEAHQIRVEQLTSDLSIERAATKKLESDCQGVERHNKELQTKLAELEASDENRAKAQIAGLEAKILNLEEQLNAVNELAAAARTVRELETGLKDLTVQLEDERRRVDQYKSEVPTEARAQREQSESEAGAEAEPEPEPEPVAAMARYGAPFFLMDGVQRSGVRGGNIFCTRCLRFGEHTWHDCKLPLNQSRCINCGQNHGRPWGRSCPFPTVCFSCGEEGHKGANCPDKIAKSSLPQFEPSFFVNDPIRSCTLQFIEQYFTLFDSEDRNQRHKLVEAYDDDATFTMSAFDFSSETDNIRDDSWHEITRGSHNILKMDVWEQFRAELVHKGKLAILSYLCDVFPPTSHIRESFVVDVSFASGKVLCVNISGVFRDRTDTTVIDQELFPLRNFNRVFLLLNGEKGLRIVNEMLFLSTLTPNEYTDYMAEKS